jgi:hypothetical protein
MLCAQQFTEVLASSNIERFILVIWENLVLLWQSCQGMRLPRTRQTERAGRDDIHARSPKAIQEIYAYVSPISITQSVTRTHQKHSIVILTKSVVLIHKWHTNRQRKTYAQLYKENFALLQQKWRFHYRYLDCMSPTCVTNMKFYDNSPRGSRTFNRG